MPAPAEMIADFWDVEILRFVQHVTPKEISDPKIPKSAISTCYLAIFEPLKISQR